ncbi:MAG: glycoside hydrolase family 3 C-terminal domain-containing protein, partial [Clostridia bacterium]
MKDIENILKSLTLAEKASLCSGKLFWWTKANAEKGIPEIMMCDGPHGLRKQEPAKGNETIDLSAQAVCYPTASLSACSFDREMLYKMGEAIGSEAKAEKVSIVLGCGVNIKRSPLCGRNFEYFSEDPFLAGEMGANWVKGIKSKGVFASVKHFACNNQERYRMRSNVEVDERTLREIYLTAFERVVKENPRTVMCCYNSVNGEFGSENTHLLKDILRNEWGFDGVTITDWGAVNDRVKGIKATMDLEMPSSFGERDAEIKKAVESGELDVQELDNTVRRLLTLIFDGYENLEDCSVNLDDNHDISREIAENSMVLLKNQDDFLPLKKTEKVLIVGEFAENFRYQGAGSSMINAHRTENLIDILKKEKVPFEYEQGYDLENLEPNDQLIEKACEKAKSFDKIVVLAGLTTLYESEGYDRQDLIMPIAHTKLIEKLTKINKNIAVCLIGGAPVEMDFEDNVKTVLDCYLSGEAGSEAMFNILFGKTNPSGRLAETIPYKLSDIPSTKYYTGTVDTVEYREGLFVGYRYFDTANVAVRHPFGFGLSYTKFEYKDIEIS